MSNCTTSSKNTLSPKQHVCPSNGKTYHDVSFDTILHHIKNPWERGLNNQTYYFCDDPDCDVVYFALDDSTICKDELRTTVGIKESSPDALICYCYGITKSTAVENPKAKEFVIAQTKEHNCSCTTRNPSGRCCLKDFPK